MLYWGAMKKFLFKIMPAIFLAACYSPEPYSASSEYSQSTNVSDSKIGTVYPVNTSKQICNPSVSQDTVNYPGALLWLNFGKELNVIAPDTVYNVKSTKAKKVIAHDRLTVSDTSGKVLWYVFRDVEGGDCVFQDPEWSTHPNYIMALRAYDKTGSTGCSDKNLDYGIMAVRMSDKKRYMFYEKDQSEFATPHLWVDPSVTESDTSASDTTLKGFFGTKNVRLVFVSKDNEIIFRDFAKGGKEVTLKLPKGDDGKELRDVMIDSPLISPDGQFVVYNVKDKADETIWSAYIQELSANSSAIKIKKEGDMLSEPAQPHWFKYAGRLFIVWAEFAQDGAQMLNLEDFSKASTQDGSVGRTVMREVSLSAGAASDIAMEWVGDVREIAPVPMIGGRSPDSKFLATGTNYGYLIKLP